MNLPRSICNLPSSPPWGELNELAKFDAGKQSSAILNQHFMLMSKRKAWRLARTTKGKPHLENLADITFTAPVNKAKITSKHQPFQQTLRCSKVQNSHLRLYAELKTICTNSYQHDLLTTHLEMQPKKPMSPAKCRSCYRGPICTLDLFL